MSASSAPDLYKRAPDMQEAPLQIRMQGAAAPTGRTGGNSSINTHNKYMLMEQTISVRVSLFQHCLTLLIHHKEFRCRFGKSAKDTTEKAATSGITAITIRGNEQ